MERCRSYKQWVGWEYNLQLTVQDYLGGGTPKWTHNVFRIQGLRVSLCDLDVIFGLLLSGNETERCCADLIRNRPKPDSGRKPAKRRLRILGSKPLVLGPIAPDKCCCC